MSNENKIIVLGKEFTTEEERRTYFREELRKKLPELKQMEGFPIGEDEDILNLSDPPYYTACPNPWLNDFIEGWEKEKEELEKQGLRKGDFEVTEPYAADVSEGKNNPIYNAHSYHTKVPHPAIMRYILHYTQPGDVIFDGFAGTGMTKVATQMLNYIEGKEKSARKCITGDLSPFATYLDYSFNKKIISEEYITKTAEITKKIKSDYSWVYKTKHAHGVYGDIRYTIWSEFILCPNCEHEENMWSIKENSSGKTGRNVKCKNCNRDIDINKSNKSYETVYDDIIKKTIKQIKFRPVLINYEYNRGNYEKKPDDYDLKILDKISSQAISLNLINNEITNGDKMGDPLNKGYSNIHHFYTRRNLYVINKLFELAEEYNPHRWAAFNTSWHATKMRRYNSGGGHRPMSGTIYFPPNHSEGNMIEVFFKKLRDLKKFIKKSNVYKKENVLGYCDSASSVKIKKESIDYIFTDPPFGANLMYSELNLVWESWLRVKENTIKEAIQNKTQNKSLMEYQVLLNECFQNYYKFLKPGKWMTVIFSNTNAAVWNSIQNALQSSGFIVANVSSLDKKQRSINSYVTKSAVKQDLVISCYKPSSEFDQKFNQHKHSDVGVWEFVAEHLEHLPIHLVSGNSTTAIVERSPKILFDRLIAFYVQRGLPVPIDAWKFQQGLRERFIERDGMFFTNEQVQEYDRKKAEVPNFVQMSIFVANEQDAIYWLRNILEKEPKTEQDLHPLWMKEVAGNMRKGDNLPEMRTILEENFLNNDKGQWYLPDPENEADLEKLRTNRLLKQFKTLLHEINSSKKKIKEIRVEAVRAGFKQCYQDKDFKTIVQIGDRIPNKILMEDEVLLQFYDIASSRV